jgi:hypothetical protein
MGVELLGHREGEGQSEDVWEVEGCGVGSMVCSEGLFIGQEGGDKGVQ